MKLYFKLKKYRKKRPSVRQPHGRLKHVITKFNWILIYINRYYVFFYNRLANKKVLHGYFKYICIFPWSCKHSFYLFTMQ